MNSQPIFLLTFSNDPGEYLEHITQEQKGIKTALLDYADHNYIEVRDLERASSKEIFYHINRYHNKLQIFHYGGHANGEMLQLEAELGHVQHANATGIASLLGTQKDLKLVFLNGCATRAQVSALLENGVKSVIATSQEIPDDDACNFATQFYQALGTGSTLGEAYIKAKAWLEQEGKEIEVQKPGVSIGTFTTEKIPWGFYWKQGEEAILDWRVKEESPLSIDFGSDELRSISSSDINAFLVDHSLKSIKDGIYVKELARKISAARKSGDPDRKPTDAEKKDALIRSFLAPVSTHLRELFSREHSQKFDEARLRELCTTFGLTIKFLTLILLSDIWDYIHANEKKLKLSDKEKRNLLAFFDLNPVSRLSFDYFQLGEVLFNIAKANNIAFYIQELKQYSEGWSSIGTLQKAYEHFSAMQLALRQDIPSRLVDPYCLESEQHLAKVLAEFRFLIHYNMAVIKNIEVMQLKNMPPTRFRHILVELDNNHNDIGKKDRHRELEKSTDRDSVLVFTKNLNENINLSPFILDKNALVGEFNSKLYFFSHQDGDTLIYTWVENEADKMEVSAQKFPYILEQFRKARNNFLDDGSLMRKTTHLGDEDDIETLLN